MDLASYKPPIAEFGALVGKSGRWISELRAKGMMPADGATLAQFIEGWVAYRTEGTGDGSLDAERTRLTAAQADAKEMDNAIRRRELLPIADYVRALTAAVFEVRSRFLAQPSSMAQVLAAISDRQSVAAVLSDDVTARLEALSEANLDGIMEAAFGGNGEGVSDSETAAETDAESVE